MEGKGTLILKSESAECIDAVSKYGTGDLTIQNAVVKAETNAADCGAIMAQDMTFANSDVSAVSYYDTVIHDGSFKMTGGRLEAVSRSNGWALCKGYPSCSRTFSSELRALVSDTAEGELYEVKCSEISSDHSRVLVIPFLAMPDDKWGIERQWPKMPEGQTYTEISSFDPTDPISLKTKTLPQEYIDAGYTTQAEVRVTYTDGTVLYNRKSTNNPAVIDINLQAYAGRTVLVEERVSLYWHGILKDEIVHNFKIELAETTCV